MPPIFITALIGIILSVMTLSHVVPSITETISGHKIDLGIGREKAIVQQIIRYHAVRGTYPVTVDDLVAQGYWSVADNDNGFGGTYSFTVDSPKGVISISTTIPNDAKRAQYLGNYRHVFRPVDIGGGVLLAKFVIPSAGSLGAPLPTATGIPVAATAPSAASNNYWYDTSGTTAVLKVSNGATWVASSATGMAAPNAWNIVSSASALPATGTSGDVRYVYDSSGHVLNTMVYYNGGWTAIGGTSAASEAVTAGVTSLTTPVNAGAACAWDDGVMAYDNNGDAYACSDPVVNGGGLPATTCAAGGRITYNADGEKYECI